MLEALEGVLCVLELLEGVRRSYTGGRGKICSCRYCRRCACAEVLGVVPKVLGVVFYLLEVVNGVRCVLKVLGVVFYMLEVVNGVRCAVKVLGLCSVWWR